MTNREKKREWERRQGGRSRARNQETGRPIEAADPPYLHDLKAFVEGAKSWSEWHKWWRENAPVVQKREVPRLCEWLDTPQADQGVRQILDKHGLAYAFTHSSLDYCHACGEKTVKVLAGGASAEETEGLLHRLEKLPNFRGLHPGIYCPNGCSALRVTTALPRLRPEPEEAPLAPCPYCGMPLRTPLARQCRYCRRDWHDPQSIRWLGGEPGCPTSAAPDAVPMSGSAGEG